MVARSFWIDQIDNLWRKRSLVWLSGVRRVGKTFLGKSLPGVCYFDCELPSVRRLLEDPESFLEDHRGSRIVLDEVHRLNNPSELLKIAADYFQDIKIVAIGSSTLGASARFRDTLAGRKAELRLTPMISADENCFGRRSLTQRLLRGGMPPFFMAEELPERDFQEWMDAYWARDIQELFRLERRYSFLRFMELIFTQSGGMFEATRFAAPCEVSQTTIGHYLNILDSTYLVNIIRPFSTHKPTEIVSAPKIYAFDTGFVSYYKGWNELRNEDKGLLWEHYVLNELQGRLQLRDISYWRDKRNHEIDIVIKSRARSPTAIECKWSPDNFDFKNLKAFRHHYPEGDNFVVSPGINTGYTRGYGILKVYFLNLESLINTCSA